MEEDRPITTVLKELIFSFSNLMRSEIKLARVEMAQTGREAGVHLGVSLGFGLVAWLGILALTASAIIGLGELLEGRYWLSAFLVGAVLLTTGGILAFFSIRKFLDVVKAPLIKENLALDTQALTRKVADISQNFKVGAS